MLIIPLAILFVALPIILAIEIYDYIHPLKRGLLFPVARWWKKLFACLMAICTILAVVAYNAGGDYHAHDYVPALFAVMVITLEVLYFIVCIAIAIKKAS